MNDIPPGWIWYFLKLVGCGILSAYLFRLRRRLKCEN